MKKSIPIIIISISILLVIAISITFAFFVGNINTPANINYNTSLDDKYSFNVTITNETNNNVTFGIKDEQMMWSGTNEVVAISNSTFSFNLTNDSPGGIYCTYDYVWEWAAGSDNYTVSSGATKEFTVSGPITETQVPNYNAASFTVGTGSIYVFSGQTTTRNEVVTVKFYNLADTDQSAHRNKNYAGHLKVANVACDTMKYWFANTVDVYNVFPSSAGTLYSYGTLTGQRVYIAQDNTKYYACGYYSTYGKEVCLSQPYTQYGLSGHVSGEDLTATEQANAKSAILQVFNAAGINITLDNCWSDKNTARCSVGSVYCNVYLNGSVTCQDTSVRLRCYIHDDGESICNSW